MTTTRIYGTFDAIEVSEAIGVSTLYAGHSQTWLMLKPERADDIIAEYKAASKVNRRWAWAAWVMLALCIAHFAFMSMQPSPWLAAGGALFLAATIWCAVSAMRMGDRMDKLADYWIFAGDAVRTSALQGYRVSTGISPDVLFAAALLAGDTEALQRTIRDVQQQKPLGRIAVGAHATVDALNYEELRQRVADLLDPDGLGTIASLTFAPSAT